MSNMKRAEAYRLLLLPFKKKNTAQLWFFHRPVKIWRVLRHFKTLTKTFLEGRWNLMVRIWLFLSRWKPTAASCSFLPFSFFLSSSIFCILPLMILLFVFFLNSVESFQFLMHAAIDYYLFKKKIWHAKLNCLLTCEKRVQINFYFHINENMKYLIFFRCTTGALSHAYFLLIFIFILHFFHFKDILRLTGRIEYYIRSMIWHHISRWH